MAKYGDKRSSGTISQLFIARLSGVAHEKPGDPMGYWEDINRRQGQQTYDKLAILRRYITPAVYDNLLAIITADDAANPLEV